MADPTSMDEYVDRFRANYSINGYGVDVTMRVPCPFCAAAGFQSLRPAGDMRAVMQRESSCVECGRSGRTIFHVDEPGNTQVEFVQTGGADPPAWLQPPPRRVPAA